MLRQGSCQRQLGGAVGGKKAATSVASNPIEMLPAQQHQQQQEDEHQQQRQQLVIAAAKQPGIEGDEQNEGLLPSGTGVTQYGSLDV